MKELKRLTPEETKTLVCEIKSYNISADAKKQEIELKVLRLMNGYVTKLAYEYAMKSRKRVELSDYENAAFTSILKHIKDIKVSKNTTLKMIESYLYYWAKDAVQTEYREMVMPMAYSKAGYDKDNKTGSLPQRVSINMKVDTKDGERELGGCFASCEADPLERMIKDSYWLSLETALKKHYTEVQVNRFINYFLNDINPGSCYKDKFSEMLVFVKNDKEIMEIVRSIYQ